MTSERFESRGQISPAIVWLLIALGLSLFWLAVAVVLWAVLDSGSQQPTCMPPGIDAGSQDHWTAICSTSMPLIRIFGQPPVILMPPVPFR
jgi:hypothetical protein